METTAAPRAFALRGIVLASIVFAAALLLLACFAGLAAAKKRSFVGGDGKIHACYRVKGKPKGMVRVVRGRRHRCRRGERRMAWSVSSAPGANAQGQAGAATPATSTADESVLKAPVDALAARVAALEGMLPTIEALCEQSEALAKQVNLVAEVVEGLGLNGVLTGLGGLLVIPTLPAPLAPFSCPTS